MTNAIPVVHRLMSDGRQEGRLISFAVSNSPETQAAFAWACSNLFHTIDKIILIHVYDGDSLFNLQSKQSGLTVLHHYRSLCEEKGFGCEIIHAHGSTAAVIAEITKSRGCDLCVCGSRGLNAFKRAVLGSVSSKVSQLCECPVMVIKKPRDEAGAYLQVLPRRVFFYVDPENSTANFQWGLDKLLDPQIDEVYLLANYSFAARKTVPLADREQARVELEEKMEQFEATCKEKGIRTVKRLRITSAEQMITSALANSCDTLVVERQSAGRRAVDGALYAAHNASFPVVVVNRFPASPARRPPASPTASASPVGTSQTSLCSTAPTECKREGEHSACWRNSGSWKQGCGGNTHGGGGGSSSHAPGKAPHETLKIDTLRPMPPPPVLSHSCSASADGASQHTTKASSACSHDDSSFEQSLLAKSSSLEALLNNLEAVDDPCLSRSRRCGEQGSCSQQSTPGGGASPRPALQPVDDAAEEGETVGSGPRTRGAPVDEGRNSEMEEGGGAPEKTEKAESPPQKSEKSERTTPKSRALARSISHRRFSRSMGELVELMTT